jgi:tetratricopeptide (TPR) repeat protein
VPGIPQAVDAIVLSLLAKSPRSRIGHASELAARLDEARGRSYSPQDNVAAPLYRPALSGREEVRHALDNILEQAHAGRGALLLLAGESGIGKTFLCSDLMFRATRLGFRVVTGECTSLGSRTTEQMSAGPLHPLRRFLQTIADSCHARSAEERQRVFGSGIEHLVPYEPSFAAFVEEKDDTPSAALPAPAAFERVRAILTDYLRQFASDSPLLLVIDDLQWCDELTLRFLEGLRATYFAGLPLLIVGTFRADEATNLHGLIESDATTMINLGRLNDAAIAKIAGDMLAIEEPPPTLVSFLVRKSEGNPFFAAEYLRYLAGAGFLFRSRGQWTVGGLRSQDWAALSFQEPSSLTELVTRRLEALSRETQELVRAASVLGREFRLDMLAAVLGSTEETNIDASLREARQRQVIEPVDGRSFRFVHDTLREAAYAGIPQPTAARLHARSAAALEAQPLFDTSAKSGEVARHYQLAGDHRKALEFLEKAGYEAVAQSALEETASYFRQALEVAGRVGGVSSGRRARWERELGNALHDSGNYVECRQHFESALALLGRRIPPSGSTRGLATGLAKNLVAQVTHRLAPQLLHGDSDNTDSLLEAVRALDRYQQACYYTGEALPMMYACLRMLNLAECARPSPELTIAYANAHAVAGVVPSRRLAHLYRRRAIANIASAPDPIAETYFLLLAGIYSTGVGDWSEAKEMLRRGLGIAEKLNFARRFRELSGALGIAFFYLGDYTAARAQAQRLHDIAVDLDAHTTCLALLARAQVNSLEGRPDAVLKDIAATKELAVNLGRPERIWASSLNGAAHLKLGDLRAADIASRAALTEMDAAPTMAHYCIDSYRACAEVRLYLARSAGDFPAHQQGELYRLARHACKLLSGAARVFPIAQPRNLLMQGVLVAQSGRRREAAKMMRASLAAADRLGMRYDAARARLGLAAIGKGRREADTLTAEARSILSVLGADEATAATL